MRTSAEKTGSVRRVMGADLPKLISSLTLFDGLASEEDDDRVSGFLEDAAALLSAVEREGCRPCEHTLRFLRAGAR